MTTKPSLSEQLEANHQRALAAAGPREAGMPEHCPLAAEALKLEKHVAQSVDWLGYIAERDAAIARAVAAEAEVEKLRNSQASWDRIVESREVISSLEAEVARLREESEQRRKTAVDLCNERDAIRGKNERLREFNLPSDHAMRVAHQMHAELKTENTALKTENEQSRNAIDTYVSALAVSRAENERLKSALAELQKRLANQEPLEERDLDRYIARIEELERGAAAALETDLTALKANKP